MLINRIFQVAVDLCLDLPLEMAYNYYYITNTVKRKQNSEVKDSYVLYFNERIFCLFVT